MNGRRDDTVVIVGAGPAGSATAIHLARAGWKVRLLDRAAFPREKPCSEYMSPETVRMLDSLGVLDRLIAEGATRVIGSSVTAASGARLAGTFGVARGLAIARRKLDAALVDAAVAAGVELEEGLTCTGILRVGDAVRGVMVRDRRGRERRHETSLLVGADGLRSVIARDLGGRVYGGLTRHGLVAHISGVRGMGPGAEMHVTSDGYAGLNAIGGDVTNVSLVVPSERIRLASRRVESWFFSELERIPGIAGRIPRWGLVREVMVTGPFAVRAQRVTAPGAALVGDAADFFDPFTGEGICAALTGAGLLATALGAGPGAVPVDRALREYRRLRLGRFAGKWAVERMIGYAMEVPSLFNRAVERIGRRRGMADTLVNVTGAVLPSRMVLNPWFLARMVI